MSSGPRDAPRLPHTPSVPAAQQVTGPLRLSPGKWARSRAHAALGTPGHGGTMGYRAGGTGTSLLDPLAQQEQAQHPDVRSGMRSGCTAFLQFNYCSPENAEARAERPRHGKRRAASRSVRLRLSGWIPDENPMSVSTETQVQRQFTSHSKTKGFHPGPGAEHAQGRCPRDHPGTFPSCPTAALPPLLSTSPSCSAPNPQPCQASSSIPLLGEQTSCPRAAARNVC